MRQRKGIGQGSTLLLLSAAAIAGLLVSLALRVFRVRSYSMAPGLLPGDLVLGVRRLPRMPLEIGQVVALKGADRWRLKRLVGVPGDAVALRGAELFRNQRRVVEPQVRYARGGVLDLPARVVRPGEVVALGDNRDGSLDSRQLGPLPARSVGWVLVARLWPPARLGWVE